MSSQKIKAGFSLVELIIVISIISILAVFSVPIYQNFQLRNDLDLTATGITQTLRRAQLLSESGVNDSKWGIYLQNGSLTLFSGDSYASRNNNFDENTALSSAIVVSGDQEIVFEKLSGELTANKNIVLTSSNNETKNISINQKGMASY